MDAPAAEHHRQIPWWRSRAWQVRSATKLDGKNLYLGKSALNVGSIQVKKGSAEVLSLGDLVLEGDCARREAVVDWGVALRGHGLAGKTGGHGAFRCRACPQKSGICGPGRARGRLDAHQRATVASRGATAPVGGSPASPGAGPVFPRADPGTEPVCPGRAGGNGGEFGPAGLCGDRSPARDVSGGGGPVHGRGPDRLPPRPRCSTWCGWPARPIRPWTPGRRASRSSRDWRN